MRSERLIRLRNVIDGMFADGENAGVDFVVGIDEAGVDQLTMRGGEVYLEFQITRNRDSGLTRHDDVLLLHTPPAGKAAHRTQTTFRLYPDVISVLSENPSQWVQLVDLRCLSDLPEVAVLVDAYSHRGLDPLDQAVDIISRALSLRSI